MSARQAGRAGHPRGFTLLEVLLALSLIAALLAITFAGLRVGLAAWRQGSDRAEWAQHARSLGRILSRALAGTAAYTARPDEVEQAVLFFEGAEDTLSFVTVTPPFPPEAPAAFTAVTLSVEESAGLEIRQKVLPNFQPFEVRTPIFTDPTVTGIRFRYQGEESDWVKSWDGPQEGTLPRAIEVTITTATGGRKKVEHAPVIVPIRAGAP